MCCTVTPFARRWSLTSRRWQRQKTASAHMIAVRLPAAISSTRSDALTKLVREHVIGVVAKTLIM